MPDIPTPGAEPDAATNAYIEQFMRSIPDELVNEIVKGVLADTNGTLEEKVRVAFNSGASYAAEAVFTEFRSVSETLAKQAISTVNGIDGMMHKMPPALIKELATHRDPLVALLHEYAMSETLEEKVEKLLDFFRVPVACLKPDFDRQSLTKLDIAALALKIAESHPEAFVAYITLRGNPAIPCQCPGHILEAWGYVHPLEKMQAAANVAANLSANTTQGSLEGAKFIGWWLDHAREAYELAVKEGDDELPPLTAEAPSQLIASEALSKIMQGAKGADHGNNPD